MRNEIHPETEAPSPHLPTPMAGFPECIPSLPLQSGGKVDLGKRKAGEDAVFSSVPKPHHLHPPQHRRDWAGMVALSSTIPSLMLFQASPLLPSSLSRPPHLSSSIPAHLLLGGEKWKKLKLKN